MIDTRSDDVDVIALAHALWRARYFVVAVTAFFVIASVYVALTASEIYRAQAVVSEVDANNLSSGSSLGQFAGLGRLAGFNLGQNGSTREARATLKSRRLTEEFVERNALLEQLLPGDAADRSLWHAVNRFRETVLSINEDTVAGTTTISIEWTDPDTAAQWANGYAALANELLRTRDLEQSENNIRYLESQVKETNVVGIERAIYNLIENEIQTQMLANARKEYAFSVVDPAVPPEMRSKPQRKLIVLSGGVIGALVSVLLLLVWNLIMKIRHFEPESP